MSSISSRALTTLAAHTYLTKGIYEDDVRKEVHDLAALIAHDRRQPAITLDAVILAEAQREVMTTGGLLALTALANTDDGEAK